MIIDIILPLSLVFIMFTLGLGLTVDDFKNILQDPKAFVVGVIIQMILLPIVAFLIISVINFPDKMLAVGVMILACCPGGVTSNMLTKLAKGDTALSLSYTAFVSIASVFTLPFIIVGLLFIFTIFCKFYIDVYPKASSKLNHQLFHQLHVLYLIIFHYLKINQLFRCQGQLLSLL